MTGFILSTIDSSLYNLKGLGLLGFMHGGAPILLRMAGFSDMASALAFFLWNFVDNCLFFATAILSPVSRQSLKYLSTVQHKFRSRGFLNYIRVAKIAETENQIESTAVAVPSTFYRQKIGVDKHGIELRTTDFPCRVL